MDFCCSIGLLGVQSRRCKSGSVDNLQLTFAHSSPFLTIAINHWISRFEGKDNMKRNFLRNLAITVFACVTSLAAVAQNSIVLDDGDGRTMEAFSNASPVGSAPGTVQFVPNTGILVGIEAYSVGLISGTSGDFYCHHGLVSGGTGVCYFADVANNSGHVAKSFSQAMQFNSVNSSGTDVFTSIRANPQNSLEVSSGSSPGRSFGTIRQVPTIFANLPACGSTVEGTTATLTDSTVNGFGDKVEGGGSHHVLSYCDGTDWTVAAK